jgi:AsmA protein
MDEMSGEIYGVTFSASATGARLRDAPALACRIDVAPFSPRVLMEKMGHAPAATADPHAFTHAQLDAHYVLDAAGMRLDDVHATLDDTALTGELTVTDFARSSARFDLVADRLVLDRYLAPAAVRAGAGAGAFTLTSEGLRMLDVAGSLRVADLTLAGLHSTDARLRAESADDPTSVPAPGAGAGAALSGAADD